MHIDRPSPQELGELISSLVVAGFEPAGLGDFVCHYLGATPSTLPVSALGAALTTLVNRQAPHSVIGNFLFQHLKGALAPQSRLSPQPIDAGRTPLASAEQSDLIAIIDARIHASRERSAPKRVDSKAFNVRIQGKLTSITLPAAMTAEFTSRFGKERLRFVINEAAQKPVIAPGTRSYNVQLALQELLAAPNSKQYPNGLQLVQGK